MICLRYVSQMELLAAIQIGVPKRIITDIAKKDEKNPMYFVNPIIKNKQKTYQHMRRLLISSNQFAEVGPATCEVEYLDYNGEKKF